jgi:phenylalanyl-tRNA synthetase beta chain
VALFESAHVYRPEGPLEAPAGSPRGAQPATERHHVGALLTVGAPGSWRSPPAPADFFAAKGLVEALAGAAGQALEVEPGAAPFLHPGRNGRVLTEDGRAIGWVGELHPLVASEWDLEGAAAFELDADALAEQPAPVPAYGDVTSYPAVLQDIAVVVPSEVSAAELERAVREGGGELLDQVGVFDVYEGEQVGEGNRSLALRLEFRAPDRTLTDDEVAERRTEIEAAVAAIGGRLRG